MCVNRSVLSVGISWLVLAAFGAAEATSQEASKLLEIAWQELGPLTKAEEKLFPAVEKGELVDYSAPSEAENDPGQGSKWGEERLLRADCIAWLCTDSEASGLVTRQGIMVKGARINGTLRLEFARVPFPVLLQKSAVPGGVNLLHAEIHSLFAMGTASGPVNAQFATVEGNVFLADGFRSAGEVSLLGAAIHGDLVCAAGAFMNKGGRALDCSRLRVDGDVFLSNGFKAEGEVRMLGARVGGDLVLSNLNKRMML
jgi:hypothetical protein